MTANSKLLAQAKSLASEFGVTAIVASDGVTDFAWGDTHRPVNVRSVRKSLVSALYGIAVSEGRLDLDSTLADVGIDDKQPGLTAHEKTATLRNLLEARSGVYHEAAYEALSAKAKRPPRGSHLPGEHWYYNNWDFNALGVIYETVTGEDLYEGFAARIARPIGMADFSPSRCERVFERCSDFPAHTFSISAFDLARFGLVFLNHGAWAGRQVVPAGWIEETKTRNSSTQKKRN
jgi:CubicO group peptidase (beta-lactamase class C family)